MNSRPILFSAPMVRALLDGSKTQTRRVAKLTDAAHVKEVGGHRRWHPADPNAVLACPYGQPGDQLWVRETFKKWPDGYAYRADYTDLQMADAVHAPWKPSIHMPRTASRITLEITAVRLERLQDISEADAQAEGVYTDPACPAYEAYEALWEEINGAGTWANNPWVWVIEFEVVKP